MRPDRDDIAIPPFPPGITWIGSEAPVSERITARAALLVHFFELGELSGIRTLPFVSALARTYADHGLSVLGVHSPRSPLAASDEALASGLERLDPGFPVGNDREHRIWHAYGCRGWPSTFLWGQGGTLRWVQFGEGAYGETEGAVRAELAGAGELPSPVAGAAPPGRAPRAGKPSEEVFPGGSHDVPWEPGRAGEPLEVEYAGGGAWAALDGAGTVALAVDGEPTGTIDLEGPGLYELSGHPEHGIHEVRLDFDGPVRVWSLAFAPGPAR
ncbi:MAG TPA: hypothetical protein VFH44_09165 [Solirubrobacterales bacterium]|nr:hypothetical protein [Solirubrobacterales bacterium]